MTDADKELLAEVLKVGTAIAEQAMALVAEAHAGKVAPADALAKLKSLTDGLAANDAAADKALHDRFDTGAGS